MQNRSKIFLFILSLAISWMGTGCSKDSGDPDPPPPPAEENLVISTDASPLNVTAGPGFAVVLSVDSKMPPDGVRIEYDLKGESDGQGYPQGPAFDTKTAKTNVNFQSLPRQKFCIGTIKVTSKTRSTNTATTTLRMVYK